MISPRKLLPYLLALGLSAFVCLTDAALPPVQAQQIDADGTETAPAKLDINTATPEQLKSLGLGDNYVHRVIAGRPYTAKNQLVSRGVLPQDAYEPIKERLVAHHSQQQ